MDEGRGVACLDVVVKDGRIAGEGAEEAGPDDPRTQVDVEEQAVPDSHEVGEGFLSQKRPALCKTTRGNNYVILCNTWNHVNLPTR